MSIPSSLITQNPEWAELVRRRDEAPAVAAPKHCRGVPNKTELRFRREWIEAQPWYDGGDWLRFAPLTLLLPGGVRYTPDWVHRDCRGAMRAFEVKGSWKAKNARDSRTRLKVAAGVFVWMEFYAAVHDRVNGAWVVEGIASYNFDSV